MTRVPKVRFLPAVFVFCLALSWSVANSRGQSATDGAQANVARTRAEHLRHGINLSEWFAQVYDPKGYTKEHFQAWNTAQDISLIKAMGFDHVRLSVNPQPMFRPRQADELPAEYLSQLDTAVKMILDANLAVMIDIHPDSDFKQKLANESDFTEQVRR
jgi:endoglucanase